MSRAPSGRTARRWDVEPDEFTERVSELSGHAIAALAASPSPRDGVGGRRGRRGGGRRSPSGRHAQAAPSLPGSLRARGLTAHLVAVLEAAADRSPVAPPRPRRHESSRPRGPAPPPGQVVRASVARHRRLCILRPRRPLAAPPLALRRSLILAPRPRRRCCRSSPAAPSLASSSVRRPREGFIRISFVTKPRPIGHSHGCC